MSCWCWPHKASVFIVNNEISYSTNIIRVQVAHVDIRNIKRLTRSFEIILNLMFYRKADNGNDANAVTCTSWGQVRIGSCVYISAASYFFTCAVVVLGLSWFTNSCTIVSYSLQRGLLCALAPIITGYMTFGELSSGKNQQRKHQNSAMLCEANLPVTWEFS